MSSEAKPVPKSIRFDAETTQKIQELASIFDEIPTKTIARAIDYLHANKEKAIDAEALIRKSRIQSRESKEK